MKRGWWTIAPALAGLLLLGCSGGGGSSSNAPGDTAEDRTQPPRDPGAGPLADPGQPGCTSVADCPLPHATAVGDYCSEGYACVEGRCQMQELLDCSGLNQPKRCMMGVCDLSTHTCAPGAGFEGKPCDDFEACTRGDTCVAGTCTGEPYTCPSAPGKCAIGRCDPISDGCVGDPARLGTLCDRQSPGVCTLSGRCDGLRTDGCFGPLNMDCDDAIPCTADACTDAEGCIHTLAEAGTACDDGEVCTGPDTCDSAGSCTGVPIDEGEACGDLGGCSEHAGTCQQGRCRGGGAVIDGHACDDGDPCTVEDSCVAGACVPGAPVTCDPDGSPCTSDTCVPGRGCIYAHVENGRPCALDTCATGGTCLFGACQGATPAEDGSSCALGTCFTGGRCQGGLCTELTRAPGAPASCGAPHEPTVLVTRQGPAGGDDAILLFDLHRHLLHTYPAAMPGPLGVCLDERKRDGFFVTYSSEAGRATRLHKMGWSGGDLGVLESPDPWPFFPDKARDSCHYLLGSEPSLDRVYVFGPGGDVVMDANTGAILLAETEGNGRYGALAVVLLDDQGRGFWRVSAGGVLERYQEQRGKGAVRIDRVLSIAREVTALDLGRDGIFAMRGATALGSYVLLVDHQGDLTQMIPLYEGPGFLQTRSFGDLDYDPGM